MVVPAAAPKDLGRYELLFPIASGGMAKVWAARAVGKAGFQKLVAVKCMLSDLADDPHFRTMFLDEARVAGHVHSPNVVGTLDLGAAEDGTLYIAMELIVGLSLGRLMAHLAELQEPMPVDIAVALLIGTARGLHTAHDATTPAGVPLHIVHRDVSPQNVLIGVDGRARLTDFGVARAVLRATRTVSGRIKGKFSYCSPEQTRGLEVDRRSDVFSLGVVAWEILAGRRLFRAEHPMGTIRQVCEMPIPSLREMRPKIPEGVEEAILRALDRDREDRTPSARDFANELKRGALLAGMVPADPEAVADFIEAMGDSSLQKLRDRIRAASRSHEALARLAASGPVLTPSITQDIGQLTTLAADDATGQPAHSGWADEAGGGTLELGSQLRTEAEAVFGSDRDDVSTTASVATHVRARRRPMRLVGFALVASAVVGAGALALGTMGTRDEPDEPVEAPASSESVPSAREPTVHEEDPAVPERDEAVVRTDEATPEPPEVAAPTEDQVEAPMARVASKRRGRGMRRSPMRTARSEPAEVTASMMEVEPPPEPTAMGAPATMRRGIRGLDSFERDLSQMVGAR